jgi:membrane protein
MAEKKASKWKSLWRDAQALWRGDIASLEGLSKLHRFAHFWVLVWQSFTRNRCPVRASALAYASLLALIPMLAVVVSVTSSILKNEGEERIDNLVVKFVSDLVPPGTLAEDESETNRAAGDSSKGTNMAATVEANATNIAGVGPQTNSTAVSTNAGSTLAEDKQVLKARRVIARRIHRFIQNTRSGALGVTGGVLLIFAGISMLSRIEDTLNDIWGVQRGRSWFMRVMLYWGVITLVPIVLVGALGLTTGPHWESTKDLLYRAPWLMTVLFRILPLVVICLTFSVFYMLMPNTKVHWQAALIGGLVGGSLFHFNNLISVLYVSRVVSNSRIYGSLGLVPVFMIGLYCAWFILLFGAQVSYAFQNRRAYLEEKQTESINQRGREFVALRLMTCIGQRFLLSQPPATPVEMCCDLNIPTRLIQQTMNTLAAARLVVETAGSDAAYVPARPLDQISCHDVLMAMRATQGQELDTKEEPARVEVYGEFSRIQQAEKEAAACVTILALANRALARQIPEMSPARS